MKPKRAPASTPQTSKAAAGARNVSPAKGPLSKSPPRPPRAAPPFSSATWDRRIRFLAWAALAAAALLLVCLGLQRIASVDYWWQWKTGEVVAASGPPRVDTFSFTQGAEPRIEVRWAYCWALHQFTSVFGHAAATVVKTVAVVAMFGLAAWIGLILAAPALPLVSTAFVATIATLACSQRLVVRPETASYLFLLMFVFGITRLQRGRSRWLWILPLVQVLWANVHGLFILGPAVAGAWWVAELVSRRGTAGDAACVPAAASAPQLTAERARRQRAAMILLVSTLVASCLNPYGPQVLALALGQGAALGNEIQKTLFVELRSPFSFGQRFVAVVHYEILIALSVLSALVAWRRQSVFWLLLVASQLYLSTRAIRNLPLFCLLAMPFIVRNLSLAPVLQRATLARWLPAGRLIVAAATLAFALVHVWWVVTDRFYVRQYALNHFGAGIDDDYFPGGAADFLDSTNERGPLFCTESGGSYLIARGYRVFLDPRGDVYPDAFLAECLALVTQPSATGLQQLVRRWDLRVFFVDTVLTPMLEQVAQLPDWRLTYIDAQAAVFLRNDVATHIPALDLRADSQAWLARIRGTLPQPRAYATLGPFTRVTSPAPYERLARALFILDAPAASRVLYEEAVAAYPPTFRQWPALANVAARSGDLAAAARYYARAVEYEPNHPEWNWRAGLTALQSGDHATALRFADAALRLAPEDWQKLALMGTAELASGNAAAADPLLRRAIQRAPEPDPTLYRSLAKAEYGQRRVEQAIATFETAFRYDPSDATVAADLARIHAERGDTAQAATWAERALQIDPRNAIALQVRARLAGTSPPTP